MILKNILTIPDNKVIEPSDMYLEKLHDSLIHLLFLKDYEAIEKFISLNQENIDYTFHVYNQYISDGENPTIESCAEATIIDLIVESNDLNIDKIFAPKLPSKCLSKILEQGNTALLQRYIYHGFNITPEELIVNLFKLNHNSPHYSYILQHQEIQKFIYDNSETILNKIFPSGLWQPHKMITNNSQLSFTLNSLLPHIDKEVFSKLLSKSIIENSNSKPKFHSSYSNTTLITDFNYEYPIIMLNSGFLNITEENNEVHQALVKLYDTNGYPNKISKQSIEFVNQAIAKNIVKNSHLSLLPKKSSLKL